MSADGNVEEMGEHVKRLVEGISWLCVLNWKSEHEICDSKSNNGNNTIENHGYLRNSEIVAPGVHKEVWNIDKGVNVGKWKPQKRNQLL
jgi:hypothetical protein